MSQEGDNLPTDGEPVKVVEGDCLGVLAALPDGIVDAVVTDPPYGLEFMGKAFDTFNGNGLDPAFCHWLAGFTDGEGCFSVHKKNVRGYETYDCQFSITLRADDKPVLERIRAELGIGSIADRPGDEAKNPQARYCVSSQRDCLILRDLYRAFPLRAKKATDFELWSEALDEWVRHEPGEWGDMADARDRLMANRRFKPEGVRVNPYQLWCYRWAREALRALKPGGYMLAFGGSRTYHRLACAAEDAGFEVRDCLMWLYGSGFPKHKACLKPAHEPILLCRRPGPKATPLGIDECRIAPSGESRPRVGEPSQERRYTDSGGTNLAAKPGVRGGDPAGRWPANVVHDGSGEVLEAFAAFGESRSSPTKRNRKPRTDTTQYRNGGARYNDTSEYGDSGSAARFFYCAKVSKSERGEGNTHPTVKPIALCEWLVRLVCPPGGLVLDPFAGSASVGIACLRAGRRYLGVEKQPEYAEIARRRLESEGAKR